MEGREASTMDRRTELAHVEDGMPQLIADGGGNEMRGEAGRQSKLRP
jgi:hypothetical protein